MASQRANLLIALRALLLVLVPLLAPDEQDRELRRGLIGALSVTEDTLQIERTYSKRSHRQP
jgi:hypothetical protein